MAKASNRANIISKVQAVLKKHYEPVVPTTRSVMENLLFACCLEDGKYEQADECFSRLQESYFDWNEVRVTTVRELGEVFKGIPNATANALNLKNSLQSVFESQYTFDLEHLKRQNLGQAVEFLASLKGTTQFSVAYVTQMNLGGHSIPLGKGGVDTFYIVGAVNEKEAAAGSVPGLERAIPKSKGVEFGSLLHQFSADLISTPFSANVRNILLEIDPECKSRLPKRVDKKKLEAERRKQDEEAEAKKKAEKEAEEKQASKKKGVKKASAKSTTASKTAKSAVKQVKKTTKSSNDTKKTAATKKKATAAENSAPAKKKTAKPTSKKAATKKAATKAPKKTAKKSSSASKKKIVKKATKAGKKSTSKSLARKKPR